MIGPITLTPIGIIRSPHQQATGTPVQSAFAQDIEGRVELFPEYAAGLKDLEGFERIWLLYWLDRAAEPRLSVTPFLDTVQRGIFATRAPCRPNSIASKRSDPATEFHFPVRSRLLPLSRHMTSAWQ